MFSAIDLKVGSGSAEGSSGYGLVGSTYRGALVNMNVTATTTTTPPELKTVQVIGGSTEEEEEGNEGQEG